MFKFETFWLGLKPFLGVLLFFVVLLIIQKFFQYSKYRNSRYGAVSGNNFWKTILISGNYGEYLTFRILEKMKGNNKLLTNVYVPKSDGTTTEIDLLMINRAGFYVFESKNFSGWIYGEEKSKNWNQSLKGGKKIQFLSPVIQNNAHIKALQKLLGETSNVFYSYIVFSQRCELKRVSVTTPDIFVVKRDMLLFDLRKDLSKRPDVLTDDQISAFYEILQKHSLADAKTKEQHIQNIVDKKNKKVAIPTDSIVVKSVICETTQSNGELLTEETKTIESIRAIEQTTPIEDTPIYKALKQYRFETCKAEGVQAYCIFNNAQMADIISKMPGTLEDLKKVSGFGDVKCQKYGDKILEIIREI